MRATDEGAQGRHFEGTRALIASKSQEKQGLCQHRKIEDFTNFSLKSEKLIKSLNFHCGCNRCFSCDFEGMRDLVPSK